MMKKAEINKIVAVLGLSLLLLVLILLSGKIAAALKSLWSGIANFFSW
jgi:hypothetical protein